MKWSATSMRARRYREEQGGEDLAGEIFRADDKYKVLSREARRSSTNRAKDIDQKSYMYGSQDHCLR